MKNFLFCTSSKTLRKRFLRKFTFSTGPGVAIDPRSNLFRKFCPTEDLCTAHYLSVCFSHTNIKVQVQFLSYLLLLIFFSKSKINSLATVDQIGIATMLSQLQGVLVALCQCCFILMYLVR